MSQPDGEADGQQEDWGARELALMQKWNLVVWPLATGIAYLGWSPRAAVGVGLGGLVGAVNFWLTIRVVRRVFVAGDHVRRGGVAVVILKFGVLFGVVGLLLWYVRPEGVAFGTGFCTMLVAIVAKAVMDAVRGKQDEQDEAGKS